MLVKPAALLPGDRVRVVAPASPFDRESFEVGLQVLRAHYQVEHSPDLFATHRHYLAGDDARRLRELQEAWFAPEVRAIFCARGGYGAMRLLPQLSWTGTPKLLVGFSDITVLHLSLQARGIRSLHAPVLTQLGKQPADAVERLVHLLSSDLPAPALTGGTCYVPGRAEGPLLGGNLSLLTRLLGTPYLPSFRGAVLLIEDVGERPYKLDRMWTHLKLAGVFEGLAGICLGDFTGCDEKPPGATGEEILRALAEETGLPCAAGFPIGHAALNVAVPLGARVRLDASAGTLEPLESLVSSAGRA